jgi:DNA-binding NtrC family response regulator
VTPDTLTFADARSARLASAGSGSVELVGRSHAISRVQELLRRAAGSDACTLITGEPGSAVESVARELHGRSRRSDAPFVMVDCGATDTAASIGCCLARRRTCRQARARETRRPISNR